MKYMCSGVNGQEVIMLRAQVLNGKIHFLNRATGSLHGSLW